MDSKEIQKGSRGSASAANADAPLLRGKEIINGRDKSYPHCYLIQLNQIKLLDPYFPSIFGFTVTNSTHEIADRQQGNPEREPRIQTPPLPNYIPQFLILHIRGKKSATEGQEKSYPDAHLIQLNQIKLSDPYFPSIFGFTVTNATHEIGDRQQGNPEREPRIQTPPLPNYIPQFLILHIRGKKSATEGQEKSYPDAHLSPLWQIDGKEIEKGSEGYKQDHYVITFR
ncbi:hypothetical protein Cgig2_015595 [Carnegiea gigantea]|uniref:Uncharacterized protein n=1 Tax=Carnegiea gigantea TaxID=171969 RepID=A0A9Q1JXG1_9CARY|nr:hypothetical protein Cgig2_015595 [Carnegiea gigantea]